MHEIEGAFGQNKEKSTAESEKPTARAQNKKYKCGTCGKGFTR